VLEGALSRLFDEPVKVTCAGRTDAGVHATGQVVSFTSHDQFPLERLTIALNTSLPPDLSARDAARVADGFSARADAVERAYTYLVLNRREPSAVARRWMHYDYRPLDLGRMRRAAADLVGDRLGDFSLQQQNAGGIADVFMGPNRTVGLGVDQLSADANLTPFAQDAALDDAVYGQFSGNFRQLLGGALVGHRGGERNHAQR